MGSLCGMSSSLCRNGYFTYDV
nr:unnamed protein product [Callosobruchus analis]